MKNAVVPLPLVSDLACDLVNDLSLRVGFKFLPVIVQMPVPTLRNAHLFWLFGFSLMYIPSAFGPAEWQRVAYPH